jgi:hypothetical protein
MQLHRRRAQDLHAEAVERAAAAIDGLRAVYGFSLPDLSSSTIDSAEELLFWSREVARVIAGFEPRVARQRVTFSARELIGTSWRRQAARGISLDATTLGDLGNVVRARDAGVRTIGDRRSSFAVQLEGPANVRDRDAAGVIRPITQTPARLRLLTTPSGDEDAGEVRLSRRAGELARGGKRGERGGVDRPRNRGDGPRKREGLDRREIYDTLDLKNVAKDLPDELDAEDVLTTKEKTFDDFVEDAADRASDTADKLLDIDSSPAFSETIANPLD